jgi:hypothetical protein
MGVPAFISTNGEQTVTATGPISGTLDTSALNSNLRIRAFIRGLGANQSIRIAIEDTASATPFSDAAIVTEFDIKGALPPEGTYLNRSYYELPDVRVGSANTKLRGNCTAITGGASVQVKLWVSS